MIRWGVKERECTQRRDALVSGAEPIGARGLFVCLCRRAVLRQLVDREWFGWQRFFFAFGGYSKREVSTGKYSGRCVRGRIDVSYPYPLGGVPACLDGSFAI